jgi:hypothetical protein
VECPHPREIAGGRMVLTHAYGAIAPYQSKRQALTIITLIPLRLRAGAATANKKQRRLYPNGPVFGDGRAMIRSGIKATRSRPDFISRRP